MMHHTHIYLALRAMDYMVASVDNIQYFGSTRRVGATARRNERCWANDRFRIFNYYRDRLQEASWAPDDILHDNNPNHIFKIVAQDEFPNADFSQYYRMMPRQYRVNAPPTEFYLFSGEIPTIVNNIINSIGNMCRLREYNDQFSMEQIVYQFVMLSHYIADAHVPMHCDLRDDPPGPITNPSRTDAYGKPAGNYMNGNAHALLEGVWNQNVLSVIDDNEMNYFPIGINPGRPTIDLTNQVDFNITDCRQGGEIRLYRLNDNNIMTYVTHGCFQSKLRCRDLFPLADPTVRNDAVLAQVTRETFADCITSIMSIWAYIWARIMED